jgi:hypothetical protein
MNLPEGATFVDRKDKVITEGYVPYSWFYDDERRFRL